MKSLSSGLYGALALVVAAIAVPAAAAPMHVIVRGANPIIVPPPSAFDYGSSYYDSPAYIWGDPLDRYYDPAGKIPDSRYYGPRAVDLALGRTLSNNNESLLGHMLRCQASYASYNPATNFYRGSHGIPQVCYR